jgi:caffeoyl-CoA O-methyltransferase
VSVHDPDPVAADVDGYAEARTTPLPPYLRELDAEAREALPYPSMLSGPLVAGLLGTLVAAVQPRLVVEVGTYAGFSALVMAEALPPGGRIVTCELEPEHAAFARRHVDASPHAGRIEIRVGPAIETLATIDEPVDFAFIDADKGGYGAYYEALVPKLSAHGVIAIDNTLRGGRVVDAADDAGRAMDAFNAHVLADDRTTCVLLPVRDGVTLVRRT